MADTSSVGSTITSSANNAGQGLITALGTGSGLDLEGLVTKIMAAAKGPAEARLNLEKTQAEANISAYGSLQSTLASLKDAVKDLKSSSSFSKQTATSGDSTLYTATSNGTATAGTHRVEVFDMAQANKIVTQGSFANPNATMGSGTLSISFVGGSTFNVSVGASDSLTTIRDNINNASGNVGVTASLITADAGLGDGSTITELMITSDDSGKAKQLNISVADNDTTNTDNSGLSRFYFDGSDPLNVANSMSQIDAAQDARIAVDGFTAYSATNTFSNVLSGITIKILKDDEGAATPPSANMLISTDKTAVKGNIMGFVSIYNAAVTVLDKLTSYDAKTKTAGLLNGDSTVANIKQQVRKSLFGTVSGAEAGLSSLAALGITTNDDGTISINETTLDNTINTNYADLTNLFSGASGVAKKLDSSLANILGSSGSLNVRTQGFQSTLRDVDNKSEQLNARLAIQEASIRSQFSALDTLLAQLKKTSTFLDQQLGALNNIKNQ